MKQVSKPKRPQIKSKLEKCWHDYKHAIQIGNVDFVCPLCKRLLDPMEWFFMNSFKFIDVTPKKVKEKLGIKD